MQFSGPLRQVWGDAMTETGLAATLRQADTALDLPTIADRDFWEHADSRTLDAVLAGAAARLGTAWPMPLAADYARYVRDGNRVVYEAAVFARQDRLAAAVVAAAATRETGFLTEAVNGLVLLAEQSSWCWPAHDDAWRRHGSVISDADDPYVDLGAGEVVALLAWADQVLGPDLDAQFPGVRSRLRREARIRVFDPFLARRDWHWIGLDGHVHNWNAWIHANIITGALRLVDDEDLRLRILATAIADLDRYVASLPADGAIDEGYAYWWNGAARLLEGLETLHRATDGALDATGIPAIRQTVAFPHRMHLGGPWYVNFADGEARPPSDKAWRTPFHWAALVGDDAALAHASAYRDQRGPVCPLSAGSGQPAVGLGRILRALDDAAWVSAPAGGFPLVADVWLPSVEVAVARETAGSSAGLAFAAKGGTNDENHNHNDVGTFIVASDSVPVIVDLGRPTYTAKTFGPDRYDIWTMQGQWHNLPLPHGVQQVHGAQYRACDAAVAESEDSFSFRLDLTQAYPGHPVRAWLRTIALDRTAEHITITDAWDTPQGEAPHRLHLVIAAAQAPRIVGAASGAASIVVTPLEGARPVILTWDNAVASAEIEEVPVSDPLVADVWGATLWRAVLTVADSAVAHGEVVLTVRHHDVTAANGLPTDGR